MRGFGGGGGTYWSRGWLGLGGYKWGRKGGREGGREGKSWEVGI